MKCKWKLSFECKDAKYQDSGDGDPGRLIEAVEELLEQTLTLIDNNLEEGETFEYPD